MAKIDSIENRYEKMMSNVQNCDSMKRNDFNIPKDKIPLYLKHVKTIKIMNGNCTNLCKYCPFHYEINKDFCVDLIRNDKNYNGNNYREIKINFINKFIELFEK